MCGIASWFSNHTIPSYQDIRQLAFDCEKRGKDGFGFCHVNRQFGEVSVFRSKKPFSQIEDTKEWRDFYITLTKNRGDVYMMIARAAPETECATSSDNLKETLQPTICSSGFATDIVHKKQFEDILITNLKISDGGEALLSVHNGSVSNKIRDELQSKYGVQYLTKVDSEAIVQAYYTFNKDIKRTFEYLSGGFATILFDYKRSKLFLITDFKPLAMGHRCGYGTYVASTKDSIDRIIQLSTRETPDSNVWGTYYSKWLEGGTITEIDLDSGICSTIEYSPRFITPFWDSNKKLLQEEV